MKELTLNEVQEVSGGWVGVAAKYIGTSYGGYLLGEYVFEPIHDYIKDYPNQFNDPNYGKDYVEQFYDDQKNGRFWYGAE